MTFFSENTTPLAPLPQTAEEKPVADLEVIDRLSAGLEQLEQEIADLLKPEPGTKPLPMEAREKLQASARHLGKMRREAIQQRILRTLSSGDRVADIWPVDLLGLVQVVARPLAVTYRAVYKPLCLETEENAVVMADPRLLRHALEAMLTAGLEHGLHNTPVIVYLSTQSSDRTATVHVVSKGCDGHPKGCTCEARFRKNMGHRILFCRIVAHSNNGWIDHALQSSQSLDFSMTLPLVKKQGLTLV